MKWLDSWFKSDKLPEGADALMRIASNTGEARRRQAIYALASVPSTDTVFKFLQTLLNDSAVADAAIYSLGRGKDPRGNALAEKFARSGGPLAKEAANSIDFDLRSPAELLEVATKSEFYSEVEKALNALRAWGTPEAERALEVFRQGTNRPLIWEVHESLDGRGEYDGGEPVYTMTSSRHLGQPPTAEEREAERRKAAKDRLRKVFDDLLNLGEPGDIALYARQCLDSPGSGHGFSRLKSYLEQAGNNARALELRRHIESGDKSKLEQYLLDQGDDALLELLGCNNLWDRLLESERRFWRGHPDQPRGVTTRLCARFPQEMSRILTDVVLELPPSSPSAIAAVASLDHCGAQAEPQVKLVLDKLRRLLADPAWAVRRQALTLLLPIKNEIARSLLSEYLASEKDFELQSLARDFLEAEKKPSYRATTTKL
jgi:hypothetical protein